MGDPALLLAPVDCSLSKGGKLDNLVRFLCKRRVGGGACVVR